jgi:hypothetical protein
MKAGGNSSADDGRKFVVMYDEIFYELQFLGNELVRDVFDSAGRGISRENCEVHDD